MMNFKKLFIGTALSAFVTASAGAEELSTDETLEKVAHTQCTKNNNAIEILEKQRSDLASSASQYKLLLEPKQTQAIDALLKEFSALGAKIEKLSEKNVKTESLLFERGLNREPCSPISRLAK